MKWTDQGIILSTRPYGENSRIVSLLTPAYGRHAGLIKIPKTRSTLSIESGTFVEATWNARLSEHLGQWSLETTAAMGARLLAIPMALTALSSACSLTDQCLPERNPYPHLYQHLKQLIEDLVQSPNSFTSYVNYELALLKELGFGLDLSVCAATGQKHDLIYISPKTGRAVSREGGAPYKAQLLPLPQYWVDETIPPDIRTSLVVTGYFLSQHLTERQGLPNIRERLFEMVGRMKISTI
jgi:DNA repair protein RecO (recombination protein O)